MLQRSTINHFHFRKFPLAFLIFSVCFTYLSLPSASAESIIFEGSWSGAGFNLVSQDGAGVEVVYSIQEMAIEDIIVEGRTMHMVYLPGVFLPNDAGAPNLPGSGRYIAIPCGASVRMELINYQTELYRDIDIAPAPPIPFDTDNSPPIYKKDPAIYSRNEYYPDSPVKVSEPFYIRGVDAVILGVTPFQYNPITKELLVYRDLRVRIDFIGGNGHFGEDRLRSLYWEPILKGNLLNYSSLPPIEFSRIREMDEDNYEYVIIVPDDPAFIAWADSIKEWRVQQGISSGIVTLTEIGGNDAALIENFIDNAYSTWEPAPAAVLLLSDYQDSGDLYGITSPVWDDYCVSDNLYADVDEDDLPDIAFARITAQNESDLSNMIGKMLDYERQPPTDPGFYDHPLIAGGWQDDRWFILCCEVVYGYFANELGKTPVRQYAGAAAPPTVWSTNGNTYMIIDYFGPDGLGYIPESPSYLTNWGGNARGINAAINSGAFITLHRDHGDVNGWSSPSYIIPDLTSLNNDMPTFVLTINCLTGMYNNPTECFTEAFHRMHQGALGLIAASETSYSFVNDTYVWGMYDSMWPEFDPGYGMDETGPNNLRPCFGSLYGKYYLEASNWPYNTGNKVHTYHLFHHHGDAFITLYSEVPEELTVEHDATLQGGLDQFTVSADEGAIIALTVGGEIIGVVEATGAPQDISIVPQVPGVNMLVTATLYNHFRYMEEVPVIAPEWPYVVYSDVEINDASAWMPNGQLDFGEDVLLSITVHNIGNTMAGNVDVTISTDDIYTTIIDGSENYGDIPVNSTALVTDGFEIEAGENIPDMREILFEMSATDGDSVWTSNFIITAHSPVVEYAGLVIEDPAGNNNNLLDPGETADFHITMRNNGSSDASNIDIVISADNPGITIPNSLAIIADLVVGAEAIVVYQDIQTDSSIANGTDVVFELDITADGGYSNEDEFTIMVGDLRYLPSGPDGYGYMAYDKYDGEGAPVYEWFEITPQAGGPGIAFSMGNNTTAHIDLPFDFRYYGNDYDEVSICANGWVCLGFTYANTAFNVGIPNSYFPNNFIGAFWDDLAPGTGGEVSYYYDESNHRFIVEWYQVPLFAGGGVETFQVILFDPAHYPTGTGDGEIQVNYHTVENPVSVTAGIENSDGSVGLQFLYDEVYDEYAMPLEDGFAIKYTTGAGAIDDLVISISGNNVILNWGGISQADIYYIYRSTEPYFDIGGMTPIGESTDPEYIDEDALLGGLYYYCVTWGAEGNMVLGGN
ncbi:MAG: hypothetical protein HQ591_03085 [candidate division Zixibacteria bacterium]|nr:hypothetical protein [Candidatus Tariuqbacter arcticus]